MTSLLQSEPLVDPTTVEVLKQLKQPILHSTLFASQRIRSGWASSAMGRMLSRSYPTLTGLFNYAAVVSFDRSRRMRLDSKQSGQTRNGHFTMLGPSSRAIPMSDCLRGAMSSDFGVRVIFDAEKGTTRHVLGKRCTYITARIIRQHEQQVYLASPSPETFCEVDIASRSKVICCGR
jgi:hypothetical protein